MLRVRATGMGKTDAEADTAPKKRRRGTLSTRIHDRSLHYLLPKYVERKTF